MRRLVGGWLDPRARAVRVLLDTDSEGRMRYSLSVPARALATIRSALGAYDRVQARVIDPDPTPDPTRRAGVQGVRAELRLARPSSEPLAQLPLAPDPLQSFAQVLARLNHEHGDRAEIAVDLLPTVPATRRRLRRRLLQQARHIEAGVTGDGTDPRAGLGGGRPVGRRRPAEMVEQRAAREELRRRR